MDKSFNITIKQALSMISVTIMNLIMLYYLIQPHMFSTRASQYLLISFNVIYVWFILPRMDDKTDQLSMLKNGNYLILFILIHVGYIHTSRLFISQAARFMIVNVFGLFLLSLSKNRFIRHTK